MTTSIRVAPPGTPLDSATEWVDISATFIAAGRCEPDGKTTIIYAEPDPREDNKRPWHKHTLPRRKGSKR